MGQDRTSRRWRGDTAKRTIIAAATRYAPLPVQVPEHASPAGDDGIDDRNSIDADLSTLADVADEYQTLVVPMVTLPTLPVVHDVGGIAADLEGDAKKVWDGRNGGDEPPSSSDDVQAAPSFPSRRRATMRVRALGVQRLSPVWPVVRRPGLTGVQREPGVPAQSELSMTEHLRRLRSLDVMVVPGGKRVTGAHKGGRGVFGKVAEQFAFLRAHRFLLAVLTMVTALSVTVTTAVSTGQVAVFLTGSSWHSLSGSSNAPTPTPRPAPDTLDTGYYVAKYGFDWPKDTQPLPEDEQQRIIFMLPAAYKAASAYDQRYHESIEPELIVWWTHAEGIGARINYSNCANRPTRPGTNYFTNIENCPVANFWQLGYGNQFSVIYVLKNAFTDLYGNPNDTKLVQKVGQWVLDYDQQQGTVPKCGGYVCTFPAKTIDQISGGINQNTGALTEDNWWASVLSRDPAINCYMVAHALTFFNHEATRNWVGCYYAEPCWGYESNRLGDILAAWPGLRRAANIQ